MSLSNYVSLGRTGLRVSPFCLGTMTFGEDWAFGSSVEVSRQIMDRYMERGGNFIDTANVYTKGHSEKIIGDYIGSVPSKRDRMVLATKFFGNMYAGDPNAGGASRKSIVDACNHSLRRLQTDYIDLYWMHCWDRLTPIEETMSALDDLVTAGKVRYIGFSDTPAWKVTQAHVMASLRGWAPLAALQLEYSLIERTIEGELIPAAQELGLGVTPWSPLASGALTGKYTRENVKDANPTRGNFVKSRLSERTFDILDVLVRVAEQIGTTPARIALAWTQARPGITSTIIGARTLQQLDDNLAALGITLEEEHTAQLEEVSRPKLNFPADFVKNALAFGYSGTTVNGVAAPISALAPVSESERY